MAQSRPSSANADAMAILILVTGLPAAGKSSFLQAVQHLYTNAQGSQTFSLFGGARRGRVAAVFRLDDVLLRSCGPRNEEESATEGARVAQLASREVSFSPARWQAATRELLRLTEGALRTCAADEGGAAALPLVFVEDNMHLRSMRERYYRLCRRIEDKAVQMPSTKGGDAMQFAVAMLELRFTISLSTCIERNALRLQSVELCEGAHAKDKNAAVASLYVPTPVIESMHAVFDWCRDASSGAAAEQEKRVLSEKGDSSPWRWWKWTPTTQPWSLLELAVTTEPPEGSAEENEGVPVSRLPTAEELVDEFFTVTLQDAARNACRAQCAHVLQRRERRRQAEASAAMSREQRNEAHVRTHTHELDLQLRALAHTFLKAQHTPAVGKQVGKLKNGVLQRFKEGSRAYAAVQRSRGHENASRGENADEDDVAELHEACLMDYQNALVSLWERGERREETQ
ncbi:hypothetical protein ABB37_03974 [Leptomonas pyrrhocoris]|uniref:Uncharacterized protein n=1 Tax=Leptomonas pyrrhocoris TaxID=157538 RepID=A0A0M9G3K6_LEPPY|nr:hypothetical protein ABB37_03974 [Leptomonas pyrrhocoris]KPA81655.1 hypothetical protein ABB37_03974 [Leptomonas pyrrhocoris]|eukprot:XP_015660094.1 hypothetical protein ABB37_03974 [Leptomonas pyrrhocoris]